MNARTLPALLLLLALWFQPGTAKADVVYESAQIVDANFFIITVQFAYEGDDLKFAVFHREYGEPKLRCHVVYRVKDDISYPLSATLTLNDTTRRDLLQEGGLFNVENGFVKKLDLRLKPSNLKEFIKENSKDISLDALLTFLRQKTV